MLGKMGSSRNGAAIQVSATSSPHEGIISIIGPGMRVIGECMSEGTLRVDGTVEGGIRAAKAVIVGRDGVVIGDIVTQDAVIGGRVVGAISALTRLELQATSVVEGDVRAKQIKLEEGGAVNGNIRVGELSLEMSPLPDHSQLTTTNKAAAGG